MLFLPSGLQVIERRKLAFYHVRQARLMMFHKTNIPISFWGKLYLAIRSLRIAWGSLQGKNSLFWPGYHKWNKSISSHRRLFDWLETQSSREKEK